MTYAFWKMVIEPTMAEGVYIPAHSDTILRAKDNNDLFEKISSEQIWELLNATNIVQRACFIVVHTHERMLEMHSIMASYGEAAFLDFTLNSITKNGTIMAEDTLKKAKSRPAWEFTSDTTKQRYVVSTKYVHPHHGVHAIVALKSAEEFEFAKEIITANYGNSIVISERVSDTLKKGKVFAMFGDDVERATTILRISTNVNQIMAGYLPFDARVCATVMAAAKQMGF